jgi:hypothetical protein
MVIRDEVKGLVNFLKLDGRADHTQIVSQMGGSRGLDPGE